MKIKFLYVDKDGKVTLTRKELDEIMKECYDNGYEDARTIYGSSKSLTITTPYYDYNRYGDSITCDTVTTGKVTSNCVSSCSSIEGVLSDATKCEALTTEIFIS